jgi:hypothetical protein
MIWVKEKVKEMRKLKDKDFNLYLDTESYEKLKELASGLEMSVQDYIYHRIFFFFLNNQKLPRYSDLKGGGKTVRLRIPNAVYVRIKDIARERKIKLSEVMRRIISGTDFDPERRIKERGFKQWSGR